MKLEEINEELYKIEIRGQGISEILTALTEEELKEKLKELKKEYGDNFKNLINRKIFVIRITQLEVTI